MFLLTPPAMTCSGGSGSALQGTSDYILTLVTFTLAHISTNRAAIHRRTHLNGASSTRSVSEKLCSAALDALYTALNGTGTIPTVLPTFTMRAPHPARACAAAMSSGANACTVCTGPQKFASNTALADASSMSSAGERCGRPLPRQY